MPELDNQLRRVVKISGAILAGAGLALVLYPRDGLVWGLAVGIMVGIYNSITLAGRIKNLPGLSPDAARKYMKRGLFFRLGLIMAVLFFITYRLPFVNLLAVGAGILVPSCVSLNLSIVESLRLYRQSEAFMKKYYGK
ncbi:MAG: ATP synthase subunit I [Bacillota bacterium]